MYVEDGPPADAGTLRWRAGDLLPGGRYRIEREIGSWGIRSVYAIADTMTDQPALLCVLASAGSGEIAERVARLTALEHPFLPVIREYVLRDEALVLVLQVADGTTLDSCLAASPDARVAEQVAVEWGIQIAEGLAFLHGQDPPLIAADLAPAALLLTPYGRIKLLGLGPVLGLFTDAGLVGALEQGYAAPEVYAGHLSPQSDVYALGALLFRTVTGKHPSAVTPGALDATGIQGCVLTPELANALDKAMQLAPEARWQSAGEFSEALREVAALLEERALAANSAHEATTPQGESVTTPALEMPVGELEPQIVLTAADSGIGEPTLEAPSQIEAPTSSASPAPASGIRRLLGGLFRAKQSRIENA